MCELMAMSASRPAQVGPYLAHLMPRGGRTGPHADGWGVAYYEGRAARIFKDPAPAADSPLLAMLAHSPFRSTALIAHIRRANPSIFGRATGNTHPFEREWHGRSWVFAHNGKLPGLHERNPCRRSRFKPVGGTDSELAFCYLLDSVARGIGRRSRWSAATVVEHLEPVVDELAAFGEFNFILSDGDCLYVHAHTNLHVLERPWTGDDGTLPMVLIATKPLTPEPWRALAPRSMHVFREGQEILSTGSPDGSDGDDASSEVATATLPVRRRIPLAEAALMAA